MLRYTLRQIEYAVAIWDHGSVAAASAKLGVAQPTLSASLAKLEEQMGLQLFIRHQAQGVTPSPAGFRVLAEDELDDLDVASEAGQVQRRPAARVAAEDQLRVFAGQLLQLLQVALLRGLQRRLDVALKSFFIEENGDLGFSCNL